MEYSVEKNCRKFRQFLLSFYTRFPVYYDRWGIEDSDPPLRFCEPIIVFTGYFSFN